MVRRRHPSTRGQPTSSDSCHRQNLQEMDVDSSPRRVTTYRLKLTWKHRASCESFPKAWPETKRNRKSDERLPADFQTTARIAIPPNSGGTIHGQYVSQHIYMYKICTFVPDIENGDIKTAIVKFQDMYKHNTWRNIQLFGYIPVISLSYFRLFFLSRFTDQKKN